MVGDRALVAFVVYARVFGPLGPYVPGFGVAIFVVAGAGRAACARRGVN